jgi:hypothetical protein
MALCWLHTPLDEIAKALRMDELKLEEMWGGPIKAFAKEYLLPKKGRAAARRRDDRPGRRQPRC